LWLEASVDRHDSSKFPGFEPFADAKLHIRQSMAGHSRGPGGVDGAPPKVGRARH